MKFMLKLKQRVWKKEWKVHNIFKNIWSGLNRIPDELEMDEELDNLNKMQMQAEKQLTSASDSLDENSMWTYLQKQYFCIQ